MPSSSASSFSCASLAKVAWGLPKPRMAPARNRFVYTDQALTRMFGMT